MKILDYDEFTENCRKGLCSRNTLYNKKTCKTESKQKSCYPKYLTKLEKQQEKFIQKIQNDQQKMQEAIDNNFVDQIDLKWEEVKRIVWQRDTSVEFTGSYKSKNWMQICVVWNNILNNTEKLFILDNFVEDISNSQTLSNMHIESRQRKPELKYDVNNIILAGNYFHEMFDNYLDLVTRKNMDNDRRNYWIERFKKYIKDIGGSK